MNTFVMKFQEIDEAFNINLGKISESFNVGFSYFQSVNVTHYDYYDGEYEVTPQVNAQTLETKEKFMNENVSVNAIPFFEVSNEKGGNTIYIGGSIE